MKNRLICNHEIKTKSSYLYPPSQERSLSLFKDIRDLFKGPLQLELKTTELENILQNRTVTLFKKCFQRCIFASILYLKANIMQ